VPRRRVDPVLDLPFVRNLASIARSAGYVVERNSKEVPLLGGGACIYAEKRICISEHFGELDALPVLAHEVAHALLHDAAGRDDAERAAHEHEANWVRAKVLSALGLLRLLASEGIVVGPAPSIEATRAAEAIVAGMPPRVTHYLANLEPMSAVNHGFPAPGEAVNQVILDAALILGYQVFWVGGRRASWGSIGLVPRSSLCRTI
jgi:IrrE N-terminal-like domain